MGDALFYTREGAEHPNRSAKRFRFHTPVLSQQPPDARDRSRHALVPAMIHDEKAHVIGTRVAEEREWLTVETVAGDVLEIVRPAISEELDGELMRQGEGDPRGSGR